MKPKIILSVAAITIIAIIIAAGIYFIPKIHLPKIVTQDHLAEPNYYKVAKVIDGDTIEVKIDGRIEKVRLIGLDTPETKKPNASVECYGIMASQRAHEILDNHSVKLESDSTNSNRDRYGRLLRYVYLKNGTLFNSDMIKQGFGFAYTIYPFTKKDEFKASQNQANRNRVGLWSGGCTISIQNGQYKTNAL